MKLSKIKAGLHKQALDLIHSDTPLTEDQKFFIYYNYNEGMDANIGLIGSFHTPIELAFDFQLTLGDLTDVVDLCAGTGILSFAHRLRNPTAEITCVELIKEYVDIGKRIIPDANWIHSDVFEFINETVNSGRMYNAAFSNPPFGNHIIKSCGEYKPIKYKGSEFDLIVMEQSLSISRNQSFIISSGSCPFKYSGSRSYELIDNNKFIKFNKDTGLGIQPSIGIDTGIYKDHWKNTKVTVEVVEFIEDTVCDYIDSLAEPESIFDMFKNKEPQ